VLTVFLDSAGGTAFVKANQLQTMGTKNFTRMWRFPLARQPFHHKQQSSHVN
jgi:hypothetical protein